MRENNRNVVAVVEGKQQKCGGGGGGGKTTNKLTRSRLGEFIVSIDLKISKSRSPLLAKGKMMRIYLYRILLVS